MATETLAIAAPPRITFEQRLAEAGFVLVLLLIMVGLTPFDDRTAAAIAARDAATASGDMVRQVVFLGTFGMILFGALRKHGVAAVKAVPVLIALLMLWGLVSSTWTDEPSVVARRATLAMIFVLSMLLAVDTLGASRT